MTNTTSSNDQNIPSFIVSLSVTSACLFLLYFFYHILYFLFIHFCRPPTNLLKRYQNRNTTRNKREQVWAVVTGPTSGIGLSMAKKLYVRGFSILLVGRSPERLTRVKDELLQMNLNQQVKIIEIDFSKAKPQSFHMIENELSLVDVGLLVNNVGMVLSNGLAYFIETSAKEMAKICEVNIKTMLLMTRLVLPRMIQRKSGGIINMSSMSGLHASPMLATYAATKSFINSLSTSLSEETSGLQYIDIQSVTPGFVSTKMSSSMFGSHGQSSKKPSICRCPPVVTADECAESSLNQLGNGQRITSGHWKHACLNIVFNITPKYIVSDITHSCMLMFQKTKKVENRFIRESIENIKSRCGDTVVNSLESVKDEREDGEEEEELEENIDVSIGLLNSRD